MSLTKPRLTKYLAVKPGSQPKLAGLDPRATPGVRDKAQAQRLMPHLTARLERLQAEMWAENKHALLIVLQGMDTSGKDGTIRTVMSGVSPLGTRVTAFKVPSEEERDHDFLWRIHKAVPGKGEIGIFNRSHYEDVLVVRVHELVPKEVWRARYAQINAFERLLTDNGVVVLKFFLHISKAEQRERLLDRVNDPVKRWKFSMGDLEERKRWGEYTAAYQDALRECSTAHAPWHIVPADRKWYRNLAISQVLVETLEEMNPQFPKPTFDPKKIKLS